MILMQGVIKNSGVHPSYFFYCNSDPLNSLTIVLKNLFVVNADTVNSNPVYLWKRTGAESKPKLFVPFFVLQHLKTDSNLSLARKISAISFCVDTAVLLEMSFPLAIK